MLVFNWPKFRNANTSDGVCARHMISSMTALNPANRPTVFCMHFHPYFWNNEKILDFLVDVSNRLEKRDSASQQARNDFQEDHQYVTQGNWLESLDPVIRDSLPHRNRMNYDGTSVENLIRALRNKKNHYDDMSQRAKQVFGSIPDGYTNYWLTKFPILLLHVHLKLCKSGLHKEENFKQYYPNNDVCEVKDVAWNFV